MITMGKYWRGAVMAAATVIAALGTTLAGDPGIQEWFGVAIILAGAIGTYVAPDLVTMRWVKPVISFLTFALVTLHDFANDQVISQQEWYLTLAALGGFLLTLVPNDPSQLAVPRTAPTALHSPGSTG